MGKPAAKAAAKATKAAATGSIAGAISLADAAKLVGRSKQWVNTLEREGWVKKEGRGLYRLTELVQGYARYLTEQRKSASKNAAQTRLQEARAAAIEQRTARDEHLLIDTNEAIAVLDEIIGGLRSELDGLPARWTRDVDKRRELEALLNDTFRRAAERLEQKASALRSSGEALDADAEDDA